MWCCACALTLILLTIVYWNIPGVQERVSWGNSPQICSVLVICFTCLCKYEQTTPTRMTSPVSFGFRISDVFDPVHGRSKLSLYQESDDIVE